MSLPWHLFISPHLDDVALSCGGYVYRLTSANEPLAIVTVVTADAPPGVRFSKLAQRHHAAWHLGDTPFGCRRREDIAAAQLLGAQYIHLDLPDAIYRRDETGRSLYAHVRDVGIALSDQQHYVPLLCQKLSEVIAAYGQEVSVYCPLTVGRHVDHLIVRRAVESLCDSSHIIYYEDYPYADQPAAVQFELSSPFRVAWHSTQIELTPEEVEARIAAVACYQSQVPGLFPSSAEQILEIVRARVPWTARYLTRTPDLRASRDRMAARLRAYMARAGGERYWLREDSSTSHPGYYFSLPEEARLESGASMQE